MLCKSEPKIGSIKKFVFGIVLEISCEFNEDQISSEFGQKNFFFQIWQNQ
jgi:hypothetical protein